MGDCECAVTVAADEAVTAGGLPVPPREGLSEALRQLLAVEVPEGEEMPEVLAEAGTEGGALGVELWQSVCEAEGESSMPFRAPAEAEWEGEPEAVLLGKPVAVMEDVLEVKMDPLRLLLEVDATVTAPKLGEMEPLADLQAVGETVPEGVPEVPAGEMVPGKEQAAGLVQGIKAERPAEGQ